MNLQETIAELEKQAAQYTEAANALRALLGESTSAGASKTAVKRGPRKGGRKGRKRGPVSAETKAKIAEALRKAHAARKARGSK